MANQEIFFPFFRTLFPEERSIIIAQDFWQKRYWGDIDHYAIVDTKMTWEKLSAVPFQLQRIQTWTEKIYRFTQKSPFSPVTPIELSEPEPGFHLGEESRAQTQTFQPIPPNTFSFSKITNGPFGTEISWVHNTNLDQPPAVAIQTLVNITKNSGIKRIALQGRAWQNDQRDRPFNFSLSLQQDAPRHISSSTQGKPVIVSIKPPFSVTSRPDNLTRCDLNAFFGLADRALSASLSSIGQTPSALLD